MAARAPKNLILIIAREFASKLATATVLADAEGRIVYFNERAELTLGRTFAEAGEMPADEWATMFCTEDVDGRPIGLDELPAGVALRTRTPAHGTFCITALDGVRRTLSTTAIPLFARTPPTGPRPRRSPRTRPEPRRIRPRARIWGCRGSLATPGADTVRYGGNTSCLEVRGDGDSLLILDAGTGIRPLGAGLLDTCPVQVHVLLTHLHIDHIEGLGFFAPVWTAGHDIHVWGPPSPLRTLRSRLAGYLSPPLFPVHLSDAPATLTFHDVPNEPWEIGGILIDAQPIEHPGPTVGFRLEHDGWSLAYLPDHEPALGLDLTQVEPDWISGIGLAAGADVLVHDAQWFDAEYPAKIGWGHSSVSDAVTFAHAAGAGRLVLWHHDPRHDDDQLERLAGRAVELWQNGGLPPSLAREGDEIALA